MVADAVLTEVEVAADVAIKPLITLEPQKPVVFGSSDKPIVGLTVIKVPNTDVESGISRYGVQLELLDKGRVKISKPVLIMGGRPYISQNKMFGFDEDGKKIMIGNGYGARGGEKRIKTLYVGDQVDTIGGNGFVLSINENNQINLDQLFVNGEPQFKDSV
jgi:hypothetical protein